MFLFLQDKKSWSSEWVGNEELTDKRPSSQSDMEKIKHANTNSYL